MSMTRFGEAAVGACRALKICSTVHKFKKNSAQKLKMDNLCSRRRLAIQNCCCTGASNIGVLEFIVYEHTIYFRVGLIRVVSPLS